jgi:hypothetical protein
MLVARGCHVVRETIPTAINFGFLDQRLQTHYFSENLVAPGIEPQTSGSVTRNSDH